MQSYPLGVLHQLVYLQLLLLRGSNGNLWGQLASLRDLPNVLHLVSIQLPLGALMTSPLGVFCIGCSALHLLEFVQVFRTNCNTCSISLNGTYYDKLKERFQTSNLKMTRFYCLKCKKETETASEIQVMTTNGRYRLHGDCTICGIHKNTFTGVDWVIKKKSKEKKKETAAKRHQTAYNRQCKKLGQKILDADDTCKQCIDKCLKEAKKRKTD